MSLQENKKKLAKKTQPLDELWIVSQSHVLKKEALQLIRLLFAEASSQMVSVEEKPFLKNENEERRLRYSKLCKNWTEN